MRVCIGVRNREGYPYRELLSGIVANGDDVVHGALRDYDAFVTWNLYGANAQKAKTHHGLHVVMENGYFRDGKTYLMECGGFNGRGRVPDVPDDNGERLDKTFGVTIAPWRKDGKYILVCGQRGGTYSDLAMPRDWPDDVLMKIRLNTDRPIIYRPHPGRQCEPNYTYPGTTIGDHTKPIEHYLADAFAVVVWTSNSAVDALSHGVPVFCCGPSSAVLDLCSRDIANIETPIYPDNRREVFSKLAWHQHTVDEVRTGKAWARAREWK